MALPSVEHAHKFWSYCPFTGKIASRITGEVCRQRNGEGYLMVEHRGKRVRQHRLAWLLHYGENPPPVLDHINGDRADNRIANLRAATSRQNAWNRKLSPGVIRGVHKHSRDGTWEARFGNRYLGTFETFEQAVAVRRAVEKIFYELHGEFSRVA